LSPDDALRQHCVRSRYQALSEIKNSECVRAHSGGRPCSVERLYRLIDPLVRQIEGAEVHADADTRMEVLMRADGFLRIHVRGFHEPSRLVRADWEQSGVD